MNKAEINQFELILGCSVKYINKIFLKLIVFLLHNIDHQLYLKIDMI